MDWHVEYVETYQVWYPGHAQEDSPLLVSDRDWEMTSGWRVP